MKFTLSIIAQLQQKQPAQRGDFLFRWGKPANYGVEKEQHLNGQHNPRWIPNDYERFGGMISIFNNLHGNLFGNLENKSAVVVINPDPDNDGVYEMEAGHFLPETYNYILPDASSVNDTMYSIYMSGAVMQPNGHFITCEGERGRITEFNQAGEVVWMYQSPVIETGQLPQQGSTIKAEVYKVEKYPADYPGLLGRDLCGTATIENENPLSDACIQFWHPYITFLHTIDGAKADFSLAAEHLDNLMWDFGDGTTSNQNNPSHIFEMPGTYEVCLSYSNCFGNDRYCKSIEIMITAAHQINKEANLLHTNIIKHYLHFTKKTVEKVAVYNETGMEMFQTEKAPQLINVKHLPAGVYFLSVKENHKPHANIQRFVKL